MPKFKVTYEIDADADTTRDLGNLIQNTVNTIDHHDLIKLLQKVKQNPAIVKTALKFI